MLVFDSLFFEMVYLGFAIGGIVFAWTVLTVRWKMKSTAKKMSQEGIANTGSHTTHGMVYDHKRGVGVKSTSSASQTWFKRLM